MLIKKFLPYIICIVAGAVLTFFLFRLFSPAATPDKGIVNTPPAQAKKYTDAAGTVHTEIKVAQVEKATGNEPQYQHILDSMANVLKQKDKFIKDLTIAKVEHSGDFKPVYSDSNGTILHLNDDSLYKKITDNNVFPVYNTRVNYKDKYLDLSGTLNDDSSWHYTISEVLAIATHEKKKGWFSRELTVDVSSTNPNTHIVGISGIKITPKPKKWGIGINLSYSFNGTAFVPTMGIGLQRNLIRF